MLLNGSTLNGVTLNGSNRRNSGRASIIGSSTIVAVAFTLAATTCSIPADGAVVTAGIYNRDEAFSYLSGKATVHIQSTAYVLKVASASANASATVDIGLEQVHDGDAAILGSAELIPFQGDSGAISGTATLNATAELGKWTVAKAQNGNAEVSATVILYADGVDPINGSASVDPVPSIEYAGDGFRTHDGHTRVSASASLSLPDDPLQKIAEIVNDGFVGNCDASANSTIAHAGFSSSSCKATVVSGPVIDLYHQASILTPNATVIAIASLIKLNNEIVSIKGKAKAVFTGFRKRGSFIGLSGTCSINPSVGIYKNGRGILSPRAVVDSDPALYTGGSADILGQNTVLASMASNPRAHAIEKRTLVMKSEDRVVNVYEENRTIILRAS
jgi:type 1 fimbria pilin